MFQQHLFIRILFNLLLLAICTPAHANNQEAFHQRLIKADQLRSVDPQQTRQLLDSINPGSLRRPVDIDLYHFLDAHNAGFSGDYEEQSRRGELILDTAYLEESRIRAYALLTSSYLYQNRWDQAIFYSNLLKEQLENIRTPKIRDYAVYSLSYFYIKQEQYQQALTTLAGYPEEADSSKWQCVFYWQRFEAIEGLKRGLSEAELVDLKRAITICEDADESYPLIALKWAFGLDRLERGRPEETISILESSLPNLEQLGSEPMFAGHYSILMEAEFELENFKAAFEYGNKILAINHQVSIPGAEKDAYLYLAKITEQQGSPQQALAYYRKFQELEKAVFNDRIALQTAILNGTRAAEIRSVENKLRAETARLEQTKRLLNEQKSTSMLLVVLLIIVVTLLTSALLVRSRRADKKLQVMSETDPLTGCANRNHFTKHGHQFLVECRRQQQPAALILFDFDHFKQINDSYGHQTGDWAIQAALDRVRIYCREGEFIGRVGGETFAILVPDADVASAAMLADSCRATIQHLDSEPSKFKFSLSASFGVADTENSAYNLESLIKHADVALHKAKSSGRNCVVRFRPEPEAMEPDSKYLYLMQSKQAFTKA